MNRNRITMFGGWYGAFAAVIALGGFALAVSVAKAQDAGQQEKKEEAKPAEKQPEPAPKAGAETKPLTLQPTQSAPGTKPGTLPAAGPQPTTPPATDAQPGTAPQTTPARAAAPAIPTETPTGPVTGAPAIRIAEPKKDFGSQWAGPDLNHSFVIKNEGDQLLKILNVKPSCGCTLAGAYDKEIPPGGEGKVPMTMKSDKLHDRFTKTVTVESNDPATPAVRLTLTGQIKQLVDVNPSPVSFSQITEDTVKTIPVKLTNNTDKPAKFELTNPTSGCFTAELIETEAGKTYDLNVTAKPPYQPKLNRANFTIKTNLTEIPEVTVAVNAFLPPRLQIQPAQLNITAASPKETSRRLAFVNSGEKPVKVLSAVSDDTAVKVEVVEQTPGKRYELVVNLPAGYNPAAGKNITVALDDSETPELKVPIVGPKKNTREVTLEHVKSVFDGTGAKFALAMDPNRYGNTQFKVQSFPTLVVVGKDGKVEAVHAGAKQDLDKLLDAQIQKLLEGKTREAFDQEATAAGAKPRPTEALVGQMSPKATFTTLDGKTVETGVATGKVQVLDFFASWCGYCKKQIPVVNSLYTSKYADNPNVEFVAVSEDTLVQANAGPSGTVKITGEGAEGIQLVPMDGPPPGFQQSQPQPQPVGATAGEGSK